IDARLHHGRSRAAVGHEGWRSLKLGAWLYLAGVVEEDQTDRTGDADHLLDVEEHALVAAEHEVRLRRIVRTEGPEIGPAGAGFAALEQLLENRQILVSTEDVNVRVLRAKTEREPARLLPVLHGLEQRLVEIRVAAETRQIDGRGIAAP